MIEGALRGTKLGANSYENESYVEYAARQQVVYLCAQGHRVVVPMSVEAEEIPYSWECRCGQPATRQGAVEPESKAGRPVRSHWDMLLERRSVKELEDLLAERLGLLHASRGTSTRRKSA